MISVISGIRYLGLTEQVASLLTEITTDYDLCQRQCVITWNKFVFLVIIRAQLQKEKQMREESERQTKELAERLKKYEEEMEQAKRGI